MDRLPAFLDDGTRPLARPVPGMCLVAMIICSWDSGTPLPPLLTSRPGPWRQNPGAVNFYCGPTLQFSKYGRLLQAENFRRSIAAPTGKENWHEVREATVLVVIPNHMDPPSSPPWECCCCHKPWVTILYFWGFRTSFVFDSYAAFTLTIPPRVKQDPPGSKPEPHLYSPTGLSSDVFYTSKVCNRFIRGVFARSKRRVWCKSKVLICRFHPLHIHPCACRPSFALGVMGPDPVLLASPDTTLWTAMSIGLHSYAGQTASGNIYARFGGG